MKSMPFLNKSPAKSQRSSLSFDLDLPIECDDEYWETPDPEQAFKQPHNKPSVLAYFNCFLKLNQVLAFSLRTIVSCLSFQTSSAASLLRLVFHQQIKDPAWVRRAAVGAAHCRRAGFRVEQVD